MKLMAYFLLACLMLLSSISGTANTLRLAAKENCCEKSVCKHGQNQKQEKNCDNGLCNRMLSCSRCGFLPVGQLSVSKQFAQIVKRATLQTTMVMTSDYSETDWHPPKV